MFQKSLKTLRVIISLLFLIAVSSLFVDFRELIPESWYNPVLYFQFIPSVIKFIRFTGFAATGFVIILVLTLLFGRVYCSTICPFGILQDFFSFLSRKIKLIKRYRKAGSYKILRYVFLVIPVIVLLSGSIFMVNLLDPYSNFGRIASDLFRPAVVGINNLVAIILEKVHIYALYPVTYNKFHWATLWFPVAIFALILWMSVFHGRLYCNTVCPVGTVLGLISKVSFFRIKIDEKTCTKCGNCLFACKAGCIDIKKSEVDFDRCVSCYNCINSCDSNSIGYKNMLKSKPVTITGTNSSKREFLVKTLLFGLGISGLSGKTGASMIRTNKGSTDLIPENKKYPVAPPGSMSIRHFNDTCTACHLCISVCPTGVLQPSFLEYGFTGMMQPHMDYHTNYCNYECTKCGEACPTGAILPLGKEEKKLTQTGKVNFIIENCVVYNDNTACGSCSEHCPTQAVKMVPYKNGLTIPETDHSICIGCGACEYACPVRPYRAIYVNGNSIHRQANPPVIEELKVEEKEDFPF